MIWEIISVHELAHNVIETHFNPCPRALCMHLHLQQVHVHSGLSFVAQQKYAVVKDD
jgi:hypothetical protein